MWKWGGPSGNIKSVEQEILKNFFKLIIDEHAQHVRTY